MFSTMRMDSFFGKADFSTSPNSRLTDRKNGFWWRFLLLIYELSIVFNKMMSLKKKKNIINAERYLLFRGASDTIFLEFNYDCVPKYLNLIKGKLGAKNQ